MTIPIRCVAVWLLTCVAIAPRLAHAQEKKVCVEAHVAAQVARRDGKLRRAKTDLAVCSRPVCPVVIRKECDQWIGEIDKATPTLVIQVRDPEAGAVTDAQLSIDGESTLDWHGRAVEVDPGERKLRAVARDGRSVEQLVTVRPDEKDRAVRLDLPAAPKPAPRPPTATNNPAPPIGAAPAAPVSPPPDRPIPTATYVLGAVGAVGLAAFAGFAIAGRVQQSDLESGCGRTRECSGRSVDAMYRTYAIADVSLGIGAAASVAAFIVFLARPSPKPTPPRVGQHGLGFSF
jgi:hypothetical protein